MAAKRSRPTKRELEEDQFVEWMVQASDYVKERGRAFAVGAAAIVVIISSIGTGGRFFVAVFGIQTARVLREIKKTITIIIQPVRTGMSSRITFITVVVGRAAQVIDKTCPTPGARFLVSVSASSVPPASSRACGCSASAAQASSSVRAMVTGMASMLADITCGSDMIRIFSLA